MCYNELVRTGRKSRTARLLKGKVIKMTREIRVNEKNVHERGTSAHMSTTSKRKNAGAVILTKLSALYAGAVRTKRGFSDRFVALSEVLADRTAREGLFGEDRGKNYAGTDRDYISD